jgi:superfamily II DNA or RNA helicase
LALPHLIKHIYNSGSEEVIRRGKKIFGNGNVEMVDHDDLSASVTFRVKDDAYHTFYKVYISRFKDPKTMSVRCGCPYNMGELCRHEAAALFQLQDLVDRHVIGDADGLYNQRHTVLKMKQLDLKMIKLSAAPESFQSADQFLRSKKATVIEAKDERVVAEVAFEGETNKIIIQKNEERNFDTSCSCNSEKDHPLCVHKTIVLLQLLTGHGINYFDTIRNLDKEKNKLLALYGYSTADDLTGKFEFYYKEGKPFMKLLDPTIKRVTVTEGAPKPKPVVVAPQAADVFASGPKDSRKLRLGLVFSYNAHQYPYLQIDAIQGEPNDEENGFAGKVEKLDLSRFVNVEVFGEDDRNIIQQLRKILPGEVSRYLNRNSPFSGIWDNIIQQHDDELPEETRSIITEYLHPKYQRIFRALQPGFAFTLQKGKAFKTENLATLALEKEGLRPVFTVSHKKDFEITCEAKTDDGLLNIADNEWATAFIFKHDDKLYLWDKPEETTLAEQFLPQGKLVIDKDTWNERLTNFILPLTKDYTVHFGNVKKEELRDLKPDAHLLLKEQGDYLVIKPVFSYMGYEVRKQDKDRLILPGKEKLLIVHRNTEAEQAILHKIENLHSGFVRPEGSDTLALKGVEVLKNNWYFLFMDAIRDMNLPVYGFEALKSFRFNSARPSTRIFISSHTDWFDAKIDIDFGGQKVTVDDVKKALANKQQFVQLADGTLGILPEDWIRKYALLFRVGEGRDKNIKLSKYHFNIIDELYNQRDEEELVFRLEEKYEKIKDAYSIREIPPPAHLAKILRPYQISGFQWLNYLNEVGWGGILADDMGLGKTIQALCFLQYIRETRGALRALVVCPTTLMYNWENEIRKFAPLLTYMIHHGSGRLRESLVDSKVEVIITTYGTLRSDIKELNELEFDYVVLDESQAIKNPSSKVTKAASILNARNRLCLSGTPLQNNTFDIYAQMNFLNPGMLGSIDFFKNQFAVPIDKFGEKEQKEHLRKLLYPFILRRTKEQVAKDLPEKQEMILYCEMGEEQRGIYDAYRNDYRDKILGLIDTQGMQKSQLSILQGLMKLRQICDSPAIINEEQPYPNVSTKLEELGREISENISNHKALVFSQFLGMLALIRSKLDELGIKYVYFDGSTSAPDREKAIQEFQNNDECRVFLISLKAGGVGLNLTAADYVYLVDPWWNPAVEQQAIDRTHRIGQTKNIFAYRMICKDTVEDKILLLQEKKKALAADLITDDTGFVKALSRSDIEYLFS